MPVSLNAPIHSTTSTCACNENCCQNTTQRSSSTFYSSDKITAYNNGKTLAKDLVGYTNDAEQFRIMNLIEHTRHTDYLSLLKGYEDNKGLFGNSFFTQMAREDDFKIKNDLIKFAAFQLEDYLRGSGCLREAQQVADIVREADGKFSEELTKKLDKIVKTAIDYAY